jgi:hypothetical protein
MGWRGLGRPMDCVQLRLVFLESDERIQASVAVAQEELATGA